MRLENILALTHGELINSPFVSEFNHIVFDAKHVKRGDLFIAYDENSIDEAIFNGAYGIIFNKPTQISDTEIAWIKVQDLDESLKRLLRFKLIDKNITVYESNEIILKLALQVVTETKFLALEGDIKSVFQSLDNIEDGGVVLFCPQITSADIFTKIKPLPTNVIEHINIVEQTLFESSFIYDDIFYERQLISPFFLSYLEQLLHLFKSLKINFRLRKFTPIDHFEAVFTNKNFEIKEFGTSDKVLIFETSESFVQSEIEYLHKQAYWARVLYILPQVKFNTLDEAFRDTYNIVTYKNKNEIRNILKEHSFHFALIIGTDKSILSQPINLSPQTTLFDFA
ncbi:hypothetical protein [Sulfurimonas marina]|uniref:Peptidoglycan synthetase n=1 Tax=Sulfurimonas marina TaxID=2590551 RepID=A0A7M1AV13_9BACT|nr:hypothetical protein [Sulfurimonas marina]QOP41281.1 hypothetical protein FJR03_05805 [Sulfurimonas marina]